MDNFDLKKYLAEGKLNEDLFGKYATRKAPRDTTDKNYWVQLSMLAFDKRLRNDTLA